MKAQKDKKTGKWLIQYRYTDWQGNVKKSTKRGFKTKSEAEEWLRNFLVKQQSSLQMTFEDFLDVYYEDQKTRVRLSTLKNKKYNIDTKILPYFRKKRMCDITAVDIRKWQNELMSQGYKPTYLYSINSKLTAIFHFAEKYYDLKQNPCTKAGTMGKKQADEMNFWTKEEFSQFIEGVMDKQQSYVIFMTLFWTGMRIGELMALTSGDIDFEDKTITINKSYQRIDGQDVITPPKTPKSNRIISVPEFLLADIKDYMDRLYCLEPTDRLFNVSKNYIEREMQRGAKNSGVKKVRIHDLRHSHCAMLFEMGVPPLEVAERLGHEKVGTTLDVYAHLYPNKQKELSQKLENLYQEEFVDE